MGSPCFPDAMTLDRLFLDQSQALLRGEWLPKIEAALDRLGDDDLWWRPTEAANSAGTLCVHLAGNVRQWIVAGLSGADDARDRPSEFATVGGRSRESVQADLRATVDEACAVLAGLSEADLLRTYAIQGHEVTGLRAVYHAVEHFAMHAGQIVWIAKARSGRALDFYAEADGALPTLRWVSTPEGPIAP